MKKKKCKDPECPHCNPDKYNSVELALMGRDFHEKYAACYVEYKVELVWCETCRVIYVKCPTCGNNCCNAGYGTDPDDAMKPCPDCPASYDLQKNLYDSGSMGMVEKLVGKENAYEEYIVQRKIEVKAANEKYEEEKRCLKANSESDSK